ncbi:hypothetical protein D5R81_10920 [Parashewanella spongiae]|uniref:Lipoprotein n=1 Tax=Parashewanella spongiae TaxID=342950 RepID=A0A3A6TLE8_9GAMM|nr:hypothetical protein [Parashewanella spongiae]MCL1078495.1 hypothetical protein [Parashewanella spongiae]RJY14712.1 hypothetical protein D5R81_10920 [Parashewanella spongiae]
MKKIIGLSALVSIMFVSGCSTTNSIPYKASTANVITIQQAIADSGEKITLGDIKPAAGVDESPMCRLMGPVKVAPGKTLSQYIKDAFQEELFLAQVYDVNSKNVISAEVTEIKFSSISPASWKIGMRVSSNNSNSYEVSTDYRFDTSWDAYSACQNVADAFGPAVQNLLKQVVSDPKFKTLTK